MTTTTTRNGAASRHGSVRTQGFNAFEEAKSLGVLLDAAHRDHGAVRRALIDGGDDRETKARLLESIRHAALRLQDIEVYLEYIYVASLLGTRDEAGEVLWCETTLRRCSACGCTQYDCSQCVEKTGEACYWVEADLCSACVEVG